MSVGIDRSVAESGRQSRSPFLVVQLLLGLILILAILLAGMVKLFGGGWLLLACGIPYLLILVLHAVAHIFAIARAARARPFLWPVVLMSHILLIGGMLLQMDYSDAPLPHLGLTNITHWLVGWPTPLSGMTYPAAPEWMREIGLVWNLLVLVPVLCTWPILIRRGSYIDQG